MSRTRGRPFSETGSSVISAVDDDDDDDCRFVKRITQDASTALGLRVPVRCEEVSFQR